MQRLFWIASVGLSCAIIAFALAVHVGSGPDLPGRLASPAVADRRPFQTVRARVGDDDVLHFTGRVPGTRLRGMLWYVNGTPTVPKRLQLDGETFAVDLPLWGNRDVNAVFAYALLGREHVVAMDAPLRVAGPHPLPTVPPALLARERGGARAMAGSIDQALGDTTMPLAGVRQIVLHLSPRLGVVGWAVDLSAHAVPARVEAVADGRVAVFAHVGIVREDVAKALGDPRYAKSGFSAFFPSTVWTPGLHHVDVRGFDGRGRYGPLGAGFDVMVSAL